MRNLSLIVCCVAAGLLCVAAANGQIPLNPAGKVAACPANLPTAGVDGWNVKVYMPTANYNNRIFAAAYGIEAAIQQNLQVGSSPAEPDINFEDMDGCNGNVAGERQLPGLDDGADNDYYGAVITGWICFPQAKTYTFNVSSDDGFAVVIGTGKTNQLVGYFDGGRGCGAGTDFAVTVMEPGVYAIQVVFWEGGGGSGVELTRHEGTTFTLVGITRPEGMPDHPVIYGASLGVAPTNIQAIIPATNLNPGSKVADCPANLPTAGVDGWDVKVYTGMSNQTNNNSLVMAAFELKAAVDAGTPPAGSAQAEPDVNFENQDGCNGNVAGERQVPGLDAGTDFNDYDALITGWICFPEAKTYTLNVSSDDGFAVVLGAGSTSQVVGYFDGGRGCGEGTFFSVRVAAAGVYAIQLIFWEGGGGSGVELTRFVNNGFVLVGTTRPGNIPDQPVIYGGSGSLGPVPIDILASIAPFDPGPDVYLNKNGAEPDADGLSSPGWDVATYPMYDSGVNLANAKASLGFDYAYNFVFGGGFTSEPNLNFNNNGGDACVIGGDRPFPGLPCHGGDRGTEYFVTVAKGWIQFPPDDGTNPYPRSYALNLNSDDGFEVLLGTGKTNQVVKVFAADRGCSGEADPASIFNLIVEEAGVYAIQIIQYDGEWGGNLEFFRRVTAPDPRESQKVLVGATGTGDQPLVFGRKNGQPAPDLLATYAPRTGIIPDLVVNLDPAQKIGDASVVSGQSGFNVKLVKPRIPNIGMSYVAWDDGKATNLSFLEFMDNLAPGAIAPTVSWRDVTEWPGPSWIACETNFPGQDARDDNFMARADGYAVFAEPGLYYLGIDVDDDGYLRFGNQTVFTTGCCPNQVIPLNVTEAGTYPVRVEMVEYGGDSRLKFYELAPGGGRVAVNDPGSRIKVYTATTAPVDVKPSWNGWTIPANRKVANVGQGGELGWNAVAAKAPGGLDLDQANSHESLAMGNGLMGAASALIENNLASLPGVALPQATDTPPYINYETGGEFFAGNTVAGQDIADLPLSRFLYADGTTPMFPTGGDAEKDFAIGFSGYIEFTQAGEYAFNCNNNSGAAVWIAGQVVTGFPFTSWAGDNTPGFIKITEPGIYDIRVDYFEGSDTGDASQNSNEVEVVQYLPNSTRHLINDPSNTPGTVKVYRDLTVAPATTLYHSPGWVPASAKVGPIYRGGKPGARVQVVNTKFLTGNGDGGIGQDKFRTAQECQELLAAVLDGVHSANQYGTLASDTVMTSINLQATADFPGANEEDFAVRVTGVLGLTKGGHIFEVASDDGIMMTMAGKVVGMSGALQGTNACSFYVKAEEDGLYPFTIEFHERGGGNQLLFFELLATVDPGTGAFTFTRELVNTGNAAKMYVGLSDCPYPFADTDRDGDVDQVDFGTFQSCFTGAPAAGDPPVIPEACSCLNRDNNAFIDALDFAAFQNCYTGPAIQWTPSNPGPPCVP